jgi:hypothetical protein
MSPTASQVRVVQGDLPSDLAVALADEAAVACDPETSGLDWHTDVIGTVQLYGPSVGVVIVTAFDEALPRPVSLLETDSVEKTRNCWAGGGADARTRTANRPITSRVTHPNSPVMARTC